jgi:hypothetical protein
LVVAAYINGGDASVQTSAIDGETDTTDGAVSVPIGQAPQAIAFVPDAVEQGKGTSNLEPLGQAGNAVHLTLASNGDRDHAPSSVSLFDQGLIQVLQASVTSLAPDRPYFLCLADHDDGSGTIEPLSRFITNPAGSAIVNASGPIRQILQKDAGPRRRWLVVTEALQDTPGRVVQVQRD